MKAYTIFSLTFFVAGSVFQLAIIQLGIEIMAGMLYGVALQFGLIASLLFLAFSVVAFPLLFLFFYLWKSWNQKGIAVLKQLATPSLFSFLSLVFSYGIPLLLSTFIVDVFMRNIQANKGIDLNTSVIHLMGLAVLAVFNAVYARIERKKIPHA